MARQRIEYYGKFTPSPTGDYSARRVRALAGLAEQVGDIALGFAEKKISEQKAVKDQIKQEEAVEKGLLAGAESAATGTAPELRQYQEYSTLKEDVTFNQSLLASYEAGIKNAIATDVGRNATSNPEDLQTFLEMSEASFQGLIGTVPETLQPEITRYYEQSVRTSGKPIATAQRKALEAQQSAEIQTALENESVNILNLARQQDSDNLRPAYQSLLDMAAKDPKLDPEKFAVRIGKLNDQIAEQYAIGRIDAAFLDNDNLTPQQKIEGAKKVVSAFKKSDIYSIENPIDPETSITLDPTERDALIKKMEQRVKDYEDGEIQKAEEAIELDAITQTQNYTASMDMVQDPSIPNAEKIVSINEAEMLGKISPSGAGKLRAYVNSVEKLKAKSNSQRFGDIIARAYDLNAQLDLEADSSAYLTGINTLREEIITARTEGELTKEDETKILKQLQTLTSAKIAGATADIASNWTQADRIIKDSLNPNLRGVAVRALFERVEAEKQNLMDEGQTITRAVERDLWERYAPEVVRQIQENRRSEVITQVREILSKPEEINMQEAQEKTVGRFSVKVVD
ncbi:MAG: hypothetical protein ACO23H_14635 [Alphaproteobacteria bacterium]